MVLGSYKISDENEGIDGTSHALGMGWRTDTIKQSSFRFPVFAPLKNDFRSPLQQDLLAISLALHRFDFSALDGLVSRFNNRVHFTHKSLLERGLRKWSGQLPRLSADHPFSSPGSHFHPRYLVRVSPELLPSEQVTAHLGCQERLVDDKNKTLLLNF
jgi:hypothetical protein